jgi:hypothetical protein
MISLHVLATKFRTKASVPIGTPIPMKPSGQGRKKRAFAGFLKKEKRKNQCSSRRKEDRRGEI